MLVPDLDIFVTLSDTADTGEPGGPGGPPVSLLPDTGGVRPDGTTAEPVPGGPDAITAAIPSGPWWALLIGTAFALTRRYGLPETPTPTP